MSVCSLLIGLALATGSPKHSGEHIHSRNTFARAGHPEQVSKWARPTYTKRSYGYYVGGGAPGKKGQGRYITEGTWGMDYIGPWTPTKKVALGWWHGRRYQGGPGSYNSEGPEIPDVPNLIRPIKKFPEHD